ncbi:MAG: hypothetical protein WD552_02300 [Candidatus Paceibacterota bacterium]
MDIEKLTKSELIAAALLISLVTAILTGAVIMLLSEGAPKDVIRVSEKIISTDAGTSSQVVATDEDSEETPSAGEVKTRDEILSRATAAVARVTASSVPPRAGVLVRQGGQLFILTNSEDSDNTAQGLFQDGVVIDLELSHAAESLSVFAVVQASGPLLPLTIGGSNPAVETPLFIVPLSQQPEIVATQVESTANNLIYTTGGSLPETSLLLNINGALLGAYDGKVGAFRLISTLMAQ